MPRSSGWLSVRVRARLRLGRPGRLRPRPRRRRSGSASGGGSKSPGSRAFRAAPPAVEDGVVDGPVVAPPDEDRLAGRRGPARGRRCRRGSAPGRSRRPRRGRSASRAARSARPNPTASSSRRRPSTSGPNGRLDDGGVGHRSRPLSRRRRPRTRYAPGVVAADLADVLLVLEDDAERLVDELGRQLARAERQQRRRPVERLGDARAPWSGPPRAADGRSPTTSRASRSGAPGHPGEHDLVLLLRRSGSRSSGRGSGA